MLKWSIDKECGKYMLKKLNFFNIIMLTVAGIVNLIGVTLFLAPVKLYDSGISG